MGEVEALDLLLKGLQVAQAAGNIDSLISDINAKKSAGMSAKDISGYLDSKIDQDEAKLKADIAVSGVG